MNHTLIDSKNGDTYKVVKRADHYEIHKNGKFIQSADSYEEACKDIEEILNCRL